MILDDRLDEKYEVIKKVRAGGMGAIYKVRHRLLDEVRIVKTIRRPGTVGLAAERFLREARAAIKLRHPNVANLYDFAVGSQGDAYIIMEYVEGWNLLEILRGYGPPPLALTLEIAHQSLRALAYLHRFKIIHRDISPDNLMLTRDVDGLPLVKLIDLGIVKALEGEDCGLTTAGIFLGKARYGSPEQLGGGAVDERSDLYSFGVVLYELLTGCCPVLGAETAALLAGHRFLPPREFAETDPGGRVPEDLRALVLKALAKRPEKRVASAQDFLLALAAIQERFPLTPGTAEEFWRVLQPVVPEAGRQVPGAERPDEKTRQDISPATLRAWSGGQPPAGEPQPRQLPSLMPPPAALPPPVSGADRDTWAFSLLRFPAAGAALSTHEPHPGQRILLTGSSAVLGLLLLGLWLPRIAEFPGTSSLAALARPALPASPSMQRGDLIVLGGPGIDAPEVKYFPAYAYPIAARGSRRTCSVRVRMLVDEKGRPSEIHIDSRDGSGLGFDATALDAARQVKFFPPLRDGIPGKMWTQLLFFFSEQAP